MTGPQRPSMAPAEAGRYIASLDILGMRFGLERIQALLAALGHPERGRRAVHVVGSNGKSSTARLAAAALRSQGLMVGTYLSPHVVGWRERIEVGGRPVSAAAFAGLLSRVRAAAEALHLEPGDRVTQFEALTAAGFLAFADAGCDAMVVEAGLGGRWDATNVLPSGAVVVLTTVDLEHTDLLGDTEARIAAEKLAVLPDGSGRLVVGALTPAAASAVAAECARRRITGWRLGQEVRVAAANQGAVRLTTPMAAYDALPLPLLGSFQRANLAVAVAAAERVLGRPLDAAPLGRALARVRMPGRMEVVPGTAPLVVLDGAHNPAGMRALAASLPEAVGERRPVAAVSVLDDKDAAAMVGAIAPAVRALVATRSRHPRAAAPDTLARLARQAGIPAEVAEGPPELAVDRAAELAGPEGAVLVCGSLYLLADVRAHARSAARPAAGGDRRREDPARAGDRLARANQAGFRGS